MAPPEQQPEQDPVSSSSSETEDDHTNTKSTTTRRASATSYDDDHLDCKVIKQMLPIRMISRVVRGFGRGSSDLGIPTANLDRSTMKLKSAACRGADDDSPLCGDNSLVFDKLPCGIYWGFCCIGAPRSSHPGGPQEHDGDDADEAGSTSSHMGIVYKAAVSIGYNPTYGNDFKTVEPHLIAPSDDPCRHASSCGETVFQDFYDQPIRLSVVGYLRPELPFEGLEKLVAAIKKDIADTETLGNDASNPVTVHERDWVQSDELL